MPACSAKLAPRGRPRYSTCPEVGDWMPSMISMVVVLPAPLGPSRPKQLPGRMPKDTPATASRAPKRLCRSMTSSRQLMVGRSHRVAKREHVAKIRGALPAGFTHCRLAPPRAGRGWRHDEDNGTAELATGIGRVSAARGAGHVGPGLRRRPAQIGRASCRERVEVSVRAGAWTRTREARERQG